MTALTKVGSGRCRGQFAGGLDVWCERNKVVEIFISISSPEQSRLIQEGTED